MAHLTKLAAYRFIDDISLIHLRKCENLSLSFIITASYDENSMGIEIEKYQEDQQ